MAFRAGVPRRRDIAANLLAFGIPVVVSTAGYLVLSVSDRFLLSRLASLSQAASYTVAYSLGTLLNVLVIMPFMLAWPAAMFSIARGTDAQRTFQVLFRWFGPFLLLATFAFSPAAILILLLLFPPSYHSAAPIIPLVAASLMFYGVSIIFGVGPGVRRKNWYTTGLTMLAAAVNLGANLILIPAYGSIGAAISTLVAYVLLAFGAYAVNQMIYPVPFEIGRFGLGLGVGIVLYSAVSALARILSLSLACTLYLGALVLYGALLLVLARRESWTVRSVAPGHREEATL
jgi:O-antigen/teichoic acid export membrane protein